LLLTTAAVLAFLAWGFWPEPVRVETANVERKRLVIAIEEEGRTRVIDRYMVSAPVDGVACRVRLQVGDPVTQGEELLSITPLASQVLDARSRARAEAAVAAAEAALQSAREQHVAAQAAADFARTELSRLQPLLVQGLITRESFDRAETEVKKTAAARQAAAFQVDVVRYELEAARAALAFGSAPEQDAGERLAIRSPIDGRVLGLKHECEGPVRTGDPLLEVGNPDALEVVVEVLSPDAVRIEPGMPVYFDRWGGLTCWKDGFERWSRRGSPRSRHWVWRSNAFESLPISFLHPSNGGGSVTVTGSRRVSCCGRKTTCFRSRPAACFGMARGGPYLPSTTPAARDCVRWKLESGPVSRHRSSKDWLKGMRSLPILPMRSTMGCAVQPWSN
jgi:biotin carboxyl carrier protein